VPTQEASAPAFPPPLAPGQFDDLTSDNPQFVPKGAPQTAPAPPPAPPETTFTDSPTPMQWPQWWPYAAGGLAALALLGAGALAWRRRKPRTLRLAAPVAGASADPAAASQPPRIDLTLEITAATRSVMMFTINYRLTIANRSERAVNDLNAAAKLVCARGAAGASAGAAQGLETIARIGPHQARSITGTLQLPLSAIAPLRQGQTPLFIPLVHVTLEGEGLPADTRTFVIGAPSASGRVHPIALDQPPGGIAGLVAQAVAVPAASAAA
jgi:Meckel syndrome type 1 protein